MKINFDFNPNSEKHEDEKRESEDKKYKLVLKYGTISNREVIYDNRKYKCKTFVNKELADDYIFENPVYIILSEDEGGINLIPSDYYGIEVIFIPYEFKKYISEILEKKEWKPLSNQRRTWKK